MNRLSLLLSKSVCDSIRVRESIQVGLKLLVRPEISKVYIIVLCVFVCFEVGLRGLHVYFVNLGSIPFESLRNRQNPIECHRP